MTHYFNDQAVKHLDGLLGYAMALTGNKSDAEDLVQETYLRAARASDRLAPNSQLKSWMFTILRNIFFNQIRHRRSGPVVVELDGKDIAPHVNADTNAVDPLRSYIEKEMQREIQQAINSLSRGVS